jgi:23S rRNA pseudouridine1911/1915/1917 synthase
MRLDKVVAAHLPDSSRGAIRALFDAGYIFVNGRPASKGDPARAGSQVTIKAPPPATETWPLRIVLETESVLIVDKPAGQPSSTTGSGSAVSVAELLLQRYPQTRDIGYQPKDAGLLSRLDNETSGLLLCAKTRHAFDALKLGATAGHLTKGYLALVEGSCTLSPTSIEFPLGPRRGSRRKVTTGPDVRGNPVPSTTRIARVEARRHASLILAEVHTAYRHQIRVHLAVSGYPLLGDKLYGGSEALGLQRHALHSHRLAWLGSAGVPSFDVTSALPSDLARVWAG